MTKLSFRCSLLFVLICFSISVTATAQRANIPDSNLRAAIKRTLGKPSSATITVADMKNMDRLWARGENIRNLTGLEHATNVLFLNLVDNSISDISPLKRLTKLINLHIDDNSISDISALANLTELAQIYLRNNSISDISSLVGLTKLKKLYLASNSISNISPLEKLNQLIDLDLANNSISDISPLEGLNQLTYLDLANNSISDISSLVANTGLGRGSVVKTTENPLSHASINTHIPALQSRGVTVEFDGPVDITDDNLRAAIENELGKASGDPITPADMRDLTELEAPNSDITDLTGLEGATNLIRLNLFGNSISDLSPLKKLTNLAYIDLANNSIANISRLENLTNLTELWLDNNAISDLSPLVRNTGLGSGDTVYISRNPLNAASISTHIPALQGRGVTVEFDAPVDIRDSGLRAAIADKLGKASSDPITAVDMMDLTELKAPSTNISDLTGLERAINLIRLDLTFNSISDISPLAELTKLTELKLALNSISDISSLSGLTQLTELSLTGNPISHLTLLARLTDLESLHLGNNSIVDLSPLAGLTNLKLLSLWGNSISDISPLVGLTQLTELYIRETAISDISSLSRLTNLTELKLENNSISDISPLVTNTGLGNGDEVNLKKNPLSNQSIATHIPALQSRGVTVEFDNIVYIPDTDLRAAIESELGVASGDDITPADMETLTELIATDKNIRNLTGLEYATKLKVLNLRDNSVSDISVLAELTNLKTLRFARNTITDISPVARLTNLTKLNFRNNSVSDIAPVARLTNLTSLWLNGNSISDISPLSGLTRLTELRLDDNSISDISPLVANTGLGNGDFVNLSANPLNFQSINTHIPALKSRKVKVLFEGLKPRTSEYTLSIPSGISLIHVPLRVTAVDGREQTIESISDLYDVLGGASTINFLITYDSQVQEWYSYFVPADTGTFADRRLTDDMGIIVGLRTPVSVHLGGAALGTNASSTIGLKQGLNVVGLPLNDSRIMRVSDLFTLDGIGGNITAIILTDGGEFKLVGRPGDPGDIAITGGQAFIMIVQNATMITISGDAWAND